MAVIGDSYVGLIDSYKLQDKNGDYIKVIEMLKEMNPILDDAIAVQCNSGTEHVHAVRAGLPTVAWGILYKGTPNSKSTVTQVTDTTGFVEGLSKVDTRLIKLAGKNGNAIRLSEAQSYLESMNQEVSSAIFYSNTASTPEQFMGLAPRFNDMSAANGKQIIDAKGTGGDLTSIWFIGWGDNQCQLLYPTGTKAGIEREDKGEQMTTDDNGNEYFVAMEKFTWHVGLAVKDWRYVVRIANIKTSDVEAGSVKLFDYMRKAYWKMQSRKIPGGKIAIYANSDILEGLDALTTNSGTSDNKVRLTTKDVQGEEIMFYRGIPLRESDAILNTESQVS